MSILEKLDNIYNLITTIEEIKKAICQDDFDEYIIDDIIEILENRNILSKKEILERRCNNAKNKIHK